ncbi:MAG: hypothetical protein ACRC30_03345 [Clostridium sp.]
MYAYRREGNITLAASGFLIISVIFFCGVFKIMQYRMYDTGDINVYKSGIDLLEKGEVLVKCLQEYSNLVEMEEEEIYEYKDEGKILGDKYRISNIKISYKGKDAEIKYENLDTKKEEKIEVYREQMLICTCEDIECDFYKKAVILIPKKGVKSSV